VGMGLIFNTVSLFNLNQGSFILLVCVVCFFWLCLVSVLSVFLSCVLYFPA